MSKNQNYINHVALVLDASGSMQGNETAVKKVTNSQIEYLAQRSKELDQETRVTVYEFKSQSQVDCVIYDKDVLRLPRIDSYRADGPSTPLIDATLKALDDLAKTPELYGEHSFLLYVLTDGQENSSRNKPQALTTRITGLPDHWTVATFVPNQLGVREAKTFGFPAANIALWDTSAKGMGEVGETIRKATDTFMTGRASGIRGYKNLFQLDVTKLTSSQVNSKLSRLGPGQFRMYAVSGDSPIADFVEERTKRPYRLGEAYYQLTKPVKVQAQKQVAIFDKKSYSVYVGNDARNLIGLPVGYEVRVEPALHPNFEIFIQSTSTNRKLFGGTNLLLIS